MEAPAGKTEHNKVGPSFGSAMLMHYNMEVVQGQKKKDDLISNESGKTQGIGLDRIDDCVLTRIQRSS